MADELYCTVSWLVMKENSFLIEVMSKDMKLGEIQNEKNNYKRVALRKYLSRPNLCKTSLDHVSLKIANRSSRL